MNNKTDGQNMTEELFKDDKAFGDELKQSDGDIRANQFLINVEKGKNCFLTGLAGTGKSFLVDIIRDWASGEDQTPTFPKGAFKHQFEDFPGYPQHLATTSSTGISARNINGRTIHSWAGIGLGPINRARVNGVEEDQSTWFRRIYEERISGAPSVAVVQNIERKIKGTVILIIDEVSMIPGVLLDYLDFYFKELRGRDVDEKQADGMVKKKRIPSKLPFGGIQVIFVGDFLQLPPVRQGKATIFDWAFESAAWKAAELNVTKLTKVHRQTDPHFLRLLEEFRYGRLSQEMADLLASRVATCPCEEVVRLYTVNRAVHRWNDLMLEEVDGDVIRLEPVEEGDSQAVGNLWKTILATRILDLKVGAKVMIVVNEPKPIFSADDYLADPDCSEKWKPSFVNGSIGIVTSVDQTWVEDIKTGKQKRTTVIRVKQDPEEKKVNGETVITERPTVDITHHKWSNTWSERDARQFTNWLIREGHPVQNKRVNYFNNPQDDGHFIQFCELTGRNAALSNNCSVSQFPIRLAYAMTIHKSQGLTMKSAYIDIRGAREPGQAYVALSRLESLAGLHLLDYPKMISTSAAAVRFHKSLT